MWPESSEQPKPLRTGLTTGSCATACSVAAARLLFNAESLNEVDITLPRGQTVQLQVSSEKLSDYKARASTIKDAGDDPDVTHGATVSAEIELIPDAGIVFVAGQGVGTVTRPGLALEVGEPAINPVPRQMITEHLQLQASEFSYTGGFRVTLSVADGEQLALKTMNPRLGIIGGLSILGTTGIVRPFSCAAYIASIRQGIDVARSNGQQHLAATTGNLSENYIRSRYPQLPEMALIEMGDFAGATLKHLKRNPVDHVTFAGGFGKISKLAEGHLDLHSSKSSINLAFIAEQAAYIGASEEIQQQIRHANTSIEALKLCQQHQLPLADRVCQQAAVQCAKWLTHCHTVEICAIDRQGKLVGQYQTDLPAAGAE